MLRDARLELLYRKYHHTSNYLNELETEEERSGVIDERKSEHSLFLKHSTFSSSALHRQTLDGSGVRLKGREDIPHSNTNSFHSIVDFFIDWNHPTESNSPSASQSLSLPCRQGCRSGFSFLKPDNNSRENLQVDISWFYVAFSSFFELANWSQTNWVSFPPWHFTSPTPSPTFILIFIEKLFEKNERLGERTIMTSGM